MNRSIRRDFQYISVFTIVISMLLLSGFWIFLDYKTFQHESSRLHEKYMSEHKEMLRSQVDRVVRNIGRKQKLTQQKIESEVKSRTLEAQNIITNLLSSNRGSLADETIKKLSQDILHASRFDSGQSYHFAIDTKGEVVFSPNYPIVPGQSRTKGSELSNPIIIQDVLQIASAKGKGFYEYTLKNSKGSGMHSRVAYVTYLPEFDWILGTSKHIEDTITKVQEEVSNQVEQIRFGQNDTNYVFIATYNGLGKTYPAKDKEMLEVQDINGMYVVKELIKTAKAGGGFVQYVMPKIDNIPTKAKLSYVAPIPAWEWYIGSGVHIDSIDEIITANRTLFKEKAIRHITIMLLVLLGLIAVHSFTTYIISRQVWQQLQLFAHFFKKASKESLSIDNSKLIYDEFREIGAMANAMLQEKNIIFREVSRSRDEWVNTFNAIGDCVMVIDSQGVIIRANSAAAAIHGTHLDQLLHTPFNDFCHLDTPVNQTLIDHLPHNDEVYNEKLGRYFLSSSFPIFSNDGVMDRIIHIAHDITEQKQLKEQLVQSQKMEAVGTLAGGVAHDFNNILGAILGYAELAENTCPQTSSTAQHIKQIIKAGDRAKDLVNQILVFSHQAEAKRVSLAPASIVKDALKLLRASLPSTITIKEEIADNTGMILADPTQIQQILMNLGTNSYHAMENTGGELVVTLKRVILTEQQLSNFSHIKPQEFVQISVKDDGPGIDPKIQEKIFDPYFTTKAKGKGTGMGLAIVHGIINSYGGFITFTSHPESGTVFQIHLPLHDQPSITEDNPTTELTPGSEHILFIDDEEMLVEMSQVMLQQLGYKVTSFTNSTEALEAFSNQPDQFDLVITDQTMPDLTGLELAAHMLKLRPELPIILCTGFSALVSEDKAKLLGIRHLANKPIHMAKLATLIRKALTTES